jgi:radical SAM superfamily enzyme YgiQ (UPF0313 family)
VKILLIDPPGCPKGLFGHRHYLRDWTGANFPGYIPFPPLDLMYAAAYLKGHGHKAKIIEANAQHLRNEQILKILQKEDPEFVLISSTYLTLKEDKMLAAFIRRSVPGVKIIFSGPLMTYNPSLALGDGSADFVALGELELPLLNILEGNYIENIAYLEQGNVIIGPRRLLDLRELPIPARDLVDNQIYRYAFFNRRNPVTPMTITRGCPHSQCTFCHANLYTLGQLRFRDFDSVIEEIKEVVYRYKIREIFFRDQTFTADREFIHRICDYLITHNIDILWRVQTRVDLVDKELLFLMRKAGCYQITFGFESCSQAMLDIINKGIRLEQSRQAAKLAKRAGLEVLGLFIYGLPGDTIDSMRNILPFALELDLDFININEIFFFPGSIIYDAYSKKEGKIFPIEQLKSQVRRSYLKFYLRPAYLIRNFTRIGSFSGLNFLIRFSWNELVAHFGKSRY